MIRDKQKEFNDAMKKYHSVNYYQLTNILVSFINIALQIILLFILFSLSLSFWNWMLVLFIAYFLTDFINGFVHLYMDNNDSYDSFFGPFIASFHLHHKTPIYKDKNLFLIYYDESGTKFWLVIYLFLVVSLWTLEINQIVLAILILVGVLSSFAELSHYLCHNSDSKFVKFLQNIGLLLSMEHHKKHHKEDNVGYAFLNGMSDKFLDKIAQIFYGGYKEGLDKHYEKYQGEDTSNRRK